MFNRKKKRIAELLRENEQLWQEQKQDLARIHQLCEEAKKAPEDLERAKKRIDGLNSVMTPSVKPGDTVYFIYKDTVVLEGVLVRAFTEYDVTAEKYYFYAELSCDFYGLFVTYPAAAYGQTWFKTQAAAEAALLALQEEEEEE